MIVLRPDDDRSRVVWETLLDLGRRPPERWTLIGAQMVALHGFEHGRPPPSASLDGDVLVDVRRLQDGTRRLSRVLEEAGFELTEITTDVRGRRFANGRALLQFGSRQHDVAVRPAAPFS